MKTKTFLPRAAAVVAVATLASACGGPKLLPLADAQQLKAADGSYGQDIYGVRRAAGEDIPNLQGNQVVQIRTFTVKTNDFGSQVNDQEIPGAECEIVAEDATARIRTPGALTVPIYGYRSPDMTVKCIKEGYADAVAVMTKFNLTQAQKNQAVANAAASGGLIGALVGVAVTSAIAAANDPKNDDYNYPPPRLWLRPGQGSPSLDPVQPASDEPVDEGTKAASE